jgi:hypothetical protein
LKEQERELFRTYKEIEKVEEGLEILEQYAKKLEEMIEGLRGNRESVPSEEQKA